MPTTTKKPTKETEGSSGRPQKEKFEEAARELDTDQSEEAFDRALKKVAKAPQPEKKPDKNDR